MGRPRFQVVPLDGFYIALDLDADRYLAIQRNPDADVPAMLGELVEHLSVDQSDIALWPESRRASTPTADLGPRLPDCSDTRPRLRDWLALVPSAARAWYELRRAAPRQWLRIERVKDTDDVDAVICAARRFRAMRPMIPGLTRCLPHALLLRAFLETLGLQAALVIGVRVFPFEAHSWVEAGGVVLTDDVERLAGFTAIVVG